MKLLLTFIFFTLLLSCSASVKDDEISKKLLMKHIKTLASDKFEGRAPLSKGEDLTINYLADKFKKLGLLPMFDNSYFQEVNLAAITASPSNLRVKGGAFDKTYNYGSEVMLWSRRPQNKVQLENNELVFVGYGINAPEYGWNDYADTNVVGKTVLIMINDPGFATKNPKLFKGNAMTYYGRWTYKYEEAARQGAAAAIIIHNTAPAAYPWEVVQSSWSGKQFHLAELPSITPVIAEGWINYPTATEIMSKAGYNLKKLEALAAQKATQPLPLSLKVSFKFSNTVERNTSYNVGAVVLGSSAKDELMLYMAHWDHLGKKPKQKGQKDNIYNGAVDNATGTAALLELGRLFKQGKKPLRSVGFLAVTAEESGLLGSAAYVQKPAYPLHKTVGVINMDALNILGQMKDMIIVGHNSSEMEDILAKVAKTQNRTLVPEDEPEKGYFYRSDHFNFAKKGVPALYAEGGTTHKTKGKDYIAKRKAEYTKNNYHKPSDEVSKDWDVKGMIDDITLYYLTGREIAHSSVWPQWYDGNEFKAIRKASKRR